MCFPGLVLAFDLDIRVQTKMEQSLATQQRTNQQLEMEGSYLEKFSKNPAAILWLMAPIAANFTECPIWWKKVAVI